MSRSAVAFLVVFSCIALLACTGCQSERLLIQTDPIRADEESLGNAEGTATGLMLFQIIPIGQNQRFVNAYQRALASKGATRLINPTIDERWFWAWILNGYKFTVSGMAVRSKGAPRP